MNTLHVCYHVAKIMFLTMKACMTWIGTGSDRERAAA